MKYVYGTPSAVESESLWLPSPESCPPTGSEFENALDYLEDKLKAYIRAHRLGKDSCYWRGDFYRDRTQYLEVYNSALSVELFENCQSWLRGLGGLWRTATPLMNFPGMAVICYESVIRYADKKGEKAGETLQDAIEVYKKRHKQG